jgi:hypothetical protein
MTALLAKKAEPVGAGTITLVALNALERLEYFEHMYSLEELPAMDTAASERERFHLGYRLQRRNLELNARFLAYGLKEHWPELDIEARTERVITELSDGSATGTETIMRLVTALEALSGLVPAPADDAEDPDDAGDSKVEPEPAKKG